MAVMESHGIRVNREEMRRTSALLGFRLKELEQEAHFVAGEQFLITSNSQLREVKLNFGSSIKCTSCSGTKERFILSLQILIFPSI